MSAAAMATAPPSREQVLRELARALEAVATVLHNLADGAEETAANQGGLLTPEDIADRLKLSREFVLSEIRRGALKAERYGTGRRRHPRVRPEDFESYRKARLSRGKRL